MKAKWVWVAAAALAVGNAGAQEQPNSTAAGVIEHFGLEQAATPVSERPGWRKPKRILITAGFPGIVELLQSSAPGVELIVAEPGKEAAQAAKADAVIGMCSPELLAAGKSIKWIQLFTAGVERCVGIPSVAERDILVTNMQRIGGPIIAEHVLAMALGFVRGLDGYLAFQDQGEWRRGTRLHGTRAPTG